MVKKFQKNSIKNLKKKSILIFNSIGLKALEAGEVTQNQIKTVRKLLSPFVKKRVKFFWRISPNFTKTVKPFGSRMGSGKGIVSTLFCKIKPGQFLFEFSSFLNKPTLLILKKIHSKLNIKTIYVIKGL